MGSWYLEGLVATQMGRARNRALDGRTFGANGVCSLKNMVFHTELKTAITVLVARQVGEVSIENNRYRERS